MDTKGKNWRECYLLTDDNGNDDPPFRIGFDPEYGEFFREVTLENGIPLYLGRFPSFDEVLDEFT